MTRKWLMVGWLMIALTAGAQTIQIASSISGPWSNAAALAGSQGFVRLAGPGGRSIAAGTLLTVTNAAAVLSNGTLTVTAAIASNSLKQIESMTSTNIALKLNLVGQ